MKKNCTAAIENYPINIQPGRRDGKGITFCHRERRTATKLTEKWRNSYREEAHYTKRKIFQQRETSKKSNLREQAEGEAP